MLSYLAVALLSSLTAKELLDRSMAYHDPQRNWERGAFQITELAGQPDGTSRRNVLRFDNARSRFEWESSINGHAITVVVENDKAVAHLDGKGNLSSEELERYRLGPAQLLSRRNRDLFLWGLSSAIASTTTNRQETVSMRS